jgi:methionyl-tRNA formyltransferase
LNPYPAAWALMQNGKDELNIKVYEVEKIDVSHNYEIGTAIIEESTFKVAVKNGLINLLVLKLPGKRKMDVKSLLNGFIFKSNVKML